MSLENYDEVGCPSEDANEISINADGSIISEDQMNSIRITEDDCNCVAEEVTYTYSKYCWVTVSTSCVSGMVTTIEQICCQRGDCSEPDRVPYLNHTCEQVCDIYDIPYSPRK